jgi:NitT/TauT family transport system permease protein
MNSTGALSASVSSSSETAPFRPRRARLVPAWALDLLLPVATAIVFVAGWELACRQLKVPAYLVPAPSAIWADVTQKFGLIAGHTVATMRTVLFGFIASIVISLPLAVVIVSTPLLANTIYPLLVLTQSIPKVALAPVLVVLLGTNELPRVVITFLVAFFPLVLAIATGLNGVPAELIELGRVCRAGRWQELVRIRLPYAIPFIFSGLKAAITLSVVGAVVAEFVNADQGLGYLIVTSTAFFQVATAWAALIVLSMIGIVLFQVIVIVERVFFPWALSSSS